LVDIVPAKEKIHRFPGEILQLLPEANAAVGVVLLKNCLTAPRD
jgi:hypothetical protein